MPNKLNLLIPEDVDTLSFEMIINYDQKYDFTTLNTTFKNKPIICLDMDETVGYVAPLSFYINVWRNINNTNEYPPYDIFKNWFFEKGAFRPYLKELIIYLKKELDKGNINEILIFTSVDNYNGYVDYVARCIEKYCNIPENTISRIIDASYSLEKSTCGATIKELSVIGEDVILIDDKPWNVNPSNRVLGVPQYRQYCDPSDFLKFFNSKYHLSIEDAISIDFNNYPPDLNDYSNDRTLLDIIEGLKIIFK